MQKNKPICALVALTLLSGCSFIPDFKTPEFSAATQWSSDMNYPLPVDAQLASKMDWKAFFNSQELWLVVGTALQKNKDLKQAVLNIDEARALYRIERSDLLPRIDANGDAVLSKTSDRSSATGRGDESELYNANLGLTSYELDLFGKIRSQNASALNTYLATEQARNVVQNALIAEVSNAYLQLLADEKLLSLTEKTLQAQKESLNLLTKRLENGIATEQDIARAQTAVQTAQVNLEQYRRLVAQDRNALFLLMGIPQDPSFLPKSNLDQISIKDNLDPGLPSDVLLMRPDIRQAEYELLSHNADIGAARAAFFPSITLTGHYGFASQNLSDLFSSSALGAWQFLPQITVPIFNNGQNQANLDLAQIRTEKAVVNYEQAVQTAFREVADELDARATLHKQLKAQQRLIQSAQKVYDIAQARYKAGIDDYLSVLDAQRELYTAEQGQITTQKQYLSNLVNLYKVLGGGV